MSRARRAGKDAQEQPAGLLEGEFEKVCGIKGAVFCHKERFISVWETEEAAKQALKKILKMKKEGA